MRALKLLSPLIIIVVLIAGVILARQFVFNKSHRTNGTQDLGQVGGLLRPMDPNQVSPAARAAFDLSFVHLETDQEWWYLNAHLLDQQNRRFGLMVAILKDGQVFASVTNLSQKSHVPYYARDYIEQESKNRMIKVKGCTLTQPDPNKFEYQFSFEHDLGAFQLKFTALKNPLPVGGKGYIAMGEAGKSYYYSLTNMLVEGRGQIAGQELVFHGKGWMDRQWGLWRDRDFDQWHWYSMQLSNNVEIMLFDFRKHGKSITPLCDAVLADGTYKHNLRFEIHVLGHWTSPKTGKIWSSGWEIDIPELNAQLTVTPDLEDQEITDALWEGVCSINGAYGGTQVRGLAFYEARHKTW